MSDRFNATLANAHAALATEAWPYLEAGEPLPPHLLKAVGDYIGAGNYWYSNQAIFVPVGYVKVGTSFVPESGGGTPPPPSGGGLETFKARQDVSQNCAWFLITPEENGALIAAGIVVAPYNNFYTPGGTGALGVNERPDASSPSGYVFVNAQQQWQADVNQAADKRVQEIADSQNPPRSVPPPVVIP